MSHASTALVMHALHSIEDRLAAINEAWLQLMRHGRCEDAWRLSDEAQRLRKGIDCSSWPRHLQFIWDGTPLAGRHVLIRCYHGLGDTIQFARFVQDVRRTARKVSLWAQPVLVPLLRTLAGADTVVPLTDGTPPVEYDVDIELSELAHALRVHTLSMESCVPYLHVEPLRLSRSGRPAVGIVWRAGEWDASRSIPCEQLAPLGSSANVDWWVLQRGPALTQWCHRFGRVPRIASIIEEARILRGLDLLITVDTSSAHLAGALGIRVWTLLPHHADWRWMLERETTPWYPTMRLFRQDRAGAWQEVLARVHHELKQTFA